MDRFPTDKPRRHYYLFAHKALETSVRRGLAGFRRAAFENACLPAVRSIWGRVSTAEGVIDDESGHIEVTAHECAGKLVILVKPPHAEHITEAHFIAIVIDRVDEEFLRYIALEHSWNPGGSAYTVLGEWTANSHVNYGDGPYPDAQAFLDVVCARFTGPLDKSGSAGQST